MSDIALDPSWLQYLQNEFDQPYMQELKQFLQTQMQSGKHILPRPSQWFTAFNTTPFDQVRVVILGQDPYPTIGHAHGLCFSVQSGVKPLPKSLININKELLDDVQVDNHHTGYLEAWAQQGVLLLNAVLTVEAGNANSHQGKGWERFTDAAINALNEHHDHLVFVLWGSYAQKKGAMIDRQKHTVFASAHPSPLSAHRGFFGSRPFSKINADLVQHGSTPINWQLPDA